MNKSFKFSAAFKLVLMAGMATTLAACGGGDDSPAPVKPPPVVTYAMTMTGTAATGAAIDNGNVTVACKVGSGTATTDSKGSYTIKVPVPGEGPCVIAVTKGNLTLRSIAAGDGAKANVTPLSEMLVQYIAVSSGAGATATPTQLAQSANVKTIVTNPTMMSATVTEVIKVVQTAAGPGVTVPADFLTGTLIPKDATNPGNALDQVLEILKTKNVVTPGGQVAAEVIQRVIDNAKNNPVTGGTGGSGG
ncbi:hypothetical protein [Pseudoduganella sp. GCM10020061]|uniref:hypothetical protein n=1 Tax=Pseudoduganella sp. GCM10020061 TaxID=3317345 RepID=UPI00363EB398